MPTLRFSSMRAMPLLIVALAAMLLIFARSDNPAYAHEFNPSASVSVSPPEPKANADIMVGFSVNDSLPTDDPPTVLFIPAPPPQGWDISNDAPIGAIGGTFDALAILSILGITPCTFSITFSPTMYVASVDTTNTTDPWDLPSHPGGVGYSGQFAPDGDLRIGITHYPTFLNEMFPPDEVGEPLMRLWGGQNVLLMPVSMNILIYEPGQLPEEQYPAEWGYPAVFVFMDPLGQWGPLGLMQISDLCTPLSVVSTQFGISKDNPNTLINEEGHVLLTNPSANCWDYQFRLKTTSMPDADDPPAAPHGDGIENIRDSCPIDRNLGDSDGDGLDDSCDPYPSDPSPNAPDLPPGVPDEDQDNYGNWLDNCPLKQNGIEVLGWHMEQVDGFFFIVYNYGDLIGPDNQADTDGDDIGDACEGSEHGDQCRNDIDDDGDGIVNDGCPRVGDTGETGAQCDNAVDDDGDGAVNDSCPAVGDSTGRIYEVVLNGPTLLVGIHRHGVKLDDLDCPDEVPSGGSVVCTVAVENMGELTEHQLAALRVVEGCATVNGETDSQDELVVSVGPDGTGLASFTVDWAGCPDGEYTVQADACHAGDPAPAGFFGVGACPGVWDGMLDTNPSDDAALPGMLWVGSAAQ